MELVTGFQRYFLYCIATNLEAMPTGPSFSPSEIQTAWWLRPWWYALGPCRHFAEKETACGNRV